MKYVLNTCWLAVAMLPCLVSAADQACNDSTLNPVNPTSAYTIHDDGTVTDPRTGLMWKRCGEGQTFDAATASCTGELIDIGTWPTALDEAAQRSSFASHNDWRLPNIKELFSLVELCKDRNKLKINTTVFPSSDITGGSVRMRQWWSSSPARQMPFTILMGALPLGAWIFDQHKGAIEISPYDVNGMGIPYSIRLVRDVTPQ